MTDFRAAIVNEARRRLDVARQGIIDRGSLDAKRPAAWCEFGFSENLSFSDYYRAYDRSALGFAAIDKRKSLVWSDAPWVIEGEPTDDDKVTSPWEAKLSKVAKAAKLWRKLAKADEARMIGGWSALILKIADGDTLDKPVTKTVTAESLIDVTAVYANQLLADESLEDGTVMMYQYDQPATDISPAQIKKVHPDRVIIIGDPLTGRSLLKAGFNELTNLEKVTGGSGESFLKNAARAIGINYDKEVDFEDIARMYGKSPDEMHEVLNDTARDLNMSIDTILATQGATVTPLTVPVADPKPTFEVSSQSFAATVDMPVKVLIGNVTGERASSEDLKQWHGVCQAWRENEAGDIISALIERMIKLRMIESRNFSVMWTDLRESTPSDKADYADQLATIVETMARAQQTASVMGDDTALSIDEIRSALGYETQQEA